MTQAINMDCMEAMAQMPDKAFDIAIVDPPYGIKADRMTMGSGKNKKYTKGSWDLNTPSLEYFTQLMRVSHHQIICGGNYFTNYLEPTKSWVFWDKGIYGDSTFADGELLWTSFDSVIRIAKIRYKGFLGADQDRIHITQKPIKLYEWLLKNYAKDGWRILDTHLGSGSSRIAADKMGFDFVGYELDTEYFEAQEKRFAQYKSQLTLDL
jgi:site-specific DNA-methyltransferase (adenine-specific)